MDLVLALGEKGNTRIEVQLNPASSAALMLHIARVHAFTWRNARGPLDIEEGKQRPRWLDMAPAQYAGFPAPMVTSKDA